MTAEQMTTVEACEVSFAVVMKECELAVERLRKTYNDHAYTNVDEILVACLPYEVKCAMFGDREMPADVEALFRKRVMAYWMANDDKFAEDYARGRAARDDAWAVWNGFFQQRFDTLHPRAIDKAYAQVISAAADEFDSAEDYNMTLDFTVFGLLSAYVEQRTALSNAEAALERMQHFINSQRAVLDLVPVDELLSHVANPQQKETMTARVALADDFDAVQVALKGGR